MRITSKMIANNLLSVVGRNRKLAADLQLDIATTRKLRRPSDDPSGIVQVQQYNVLVGRNEQYLRNISQISGFMTNSMSALDAITDRLQDARDMAIQGTSETLDSTARAGLAKSVDELINSVVNLANSKYGNKYIFAGNKTSTEAITRSGDTVTYNGNNAKIQGKIGADTMVDYNKTGSELFAPAGGVDIFSELIKLKQGLENNDTEAIRATIDTLDLAGKQIINNTSSLGALQNRMSLTEQMINNENINLADKISKLQDTNMPEAIINSQILQVAIESGLRTMSQTLQRSLVDFVQ